jgi:hypothetical protein
LAPSMGSISGFPLSCRTGKWPAARSHTYQRLVNKAWSVPAAARLR